MKNISTKFNLTGLGDGFDEKTKKRVWEKAKPIYGKADQKDKIRKDKFQHTIKYEDFGKVSSEFGWDIDHSKPLAKGGTGHLNNLQPLQSHFNRTVKGDKYPFKISKGKK